MNIDKFSVNLLLSDNKKDLYLEIINNNSNITLKYEIYGNKNFYCNGLTKCKNCFIPTLKFKILDDNIFFLKVKIFNKNVSHSLFKFFDINEYKPDENLSMSIEDLNKKNLLESINLSNENYNSTSESEDANSNYDIVTDNEEKSDNEEN
jgi:hypothetical protein